MSSWAEGLCGGWKPGHYYSPIPSIEDVLRDEERIFERDVREIPGIELYAADQIALLNGLATYYHELPFTHDPIDGLRYYYNNVMYSYADGIFLYSMIRHVKPKRIIEIGCGFSSFVMLDTNERFFDNQIRLTLIDPEPNQLYERFKENDHTVAEILPSIVQDVPLERFQALESGDILFVDSSHVAKVGSDVNYILFEIIPRLRPGVFIHFHDMMYPFEYPRDWIVERGWFWNESYMVRAFLQFNTKFRIMLWSQFLYGYYRHELERLMPLCLKNIGASLWLLREPAKAEGGDI